MKKLLLILSLLFLLTGCANKQICGEVVSFLNEGPYVQLIVQTEENEQVKVLADGNTFVYSFSGIEEGLLSGKLIRPVITAYELRKQDGGWLAERICVESIQLPEKYLLSDGTELTVRQGFSHILYFSDDGTELLRREETVGPDHVSVGSLPLLTDLSEEAQQSITAYYQELGLLYDLEKEIETAYRAYLATDNKSEFHPSLLSQQIAPSASNEKLIWYSVYVTRPVGQGLHQQTNTQTVFNRETGAVMDTGSLFLCTEAEAARVILEASGMTDTEQKREMEKAFRFGYLNFESGALSVCFPTGSLTGQDTQHILGVEYEDLTGILQPWAIPDATE